MKIGYFHTNFPTKSDVQSGDLSLVGGGSGVAAYNLAHQMADRGHDVDIFTVADADAEGDGDLTIHSYSALFDVGDSSFSISGMMRPVLADLDIIHAHVPSPTMDFSAILAAAMRTTPLVVTCHSSIDSFEYGSYQRQIGMRLYRRAVHLFPKISDRIIVPSERFGRNSFTSQYLSKTEVIPNGVRVANYELGEKENIRHELGLPINQPIVLYLGALLEKKGPHILLEAFRKVRTEYPDAILVIAGTGPFDANLRQRATKIGVRDSVLFTGYVSEDIKPAYFNAADVFVLPSIRNHESFGIVNLEAMASRTPVVASQIGGVPDVVEDRKTGLLVNPADPEDMAHSISEILSNKTLRNKLIDNGYDFATEHSWESIAAKTERLYMEL